MVSFYGPKKTYALRRMFILTDCPDSHWFYPYEILQYIYGSPSLAITTSRFFMVFPYRFSGVKDECSTLLTIRTTPLEDRR